MPYLQTCAAVAATPAEPAVEPTRVLLADDDDDGRRALARLLRAEGYVVTEAATGHELVAYLGLASSAAGLFSPPDVVVSDVWMPGPTGLDVLAALSQSDWRIPVVLMTGARQEGMREEAERHGVVALADKPVDFEALVTAIANATRT